MIRQIERDDHPLHDDILDLQRSSLAWVSVAMIIVALGILCVGAGEPRVGSPKIWLVVGSMAAVVGVS